jgi:glycosyltransferase involved in cell wall biosynthesis
MTAMCASTSASSAVPIISIVVPVYRVPAELLRRCIESALAQTLREIEIILVDDGSPDDCGSICDEYERADGRVVVIHRANGGLTAARNTGQHAAQAPWLMFLDGDDWVEPNMCERLYEVAARDKVQLVICGISRDYSNARDALPVGLQEGKVYSAAECKQLQVRLLQYDENLATVYAKLIDKSVLDRHEIEHDESLRQGAEGLEFNLRLFEHLQSAAFVEQCLYHYVFNCSSVTATPDSTNYACAIAAFEKIRGLIDTSENGSELLPWFRNRLLYVVIATGVSGFFNPENVDPYSKKKSDYREYLAIPIIKEALNRANTARLSLGRRIILFCIRHRLFWALAIAGRVRYWQKRRK